ncbi:unnamed protein product [Microthlaspi erraticum]|uniref:Replication protein A 70 kDa DNA-binding subunit B/D first OB fold domain-containing protein n=1 Tax=Microthlaspi erraticum TaxID=1685480 RepID=A0A6D2JQ80_9BRAS|nr:unnamed protein product [Microthlaspi erraticum]
MFSLLKELHTFSTRRKPTTIRVKVYRRVEDWDASFQRTLDFILVDSEGTKIHASVNTRAMDRFDSLPEGAWAQISGVLVSTSNCRNRNHFLSTHMCMLVIPSDATITPIPPLTDRNFFKFTPFEDVKFGYFNIAYPIEIYRMEVENMVVNGGKYCRFWFIPEIPGVDDLAMVERRYQHWGHLRGQLNSVASALAEL